MTWNDFFQSLKSGAIDRVYLFAGAEEWTKNEALAGLRALLLPPGLEDLNDMTLEGVAVRQIIDAAETLPMMCERRIVTVRDWAPLLPGKSKDEENEVERLQQWLENPPESCVTVFYMRGEPDGRKKASALLKKRATAVQFDYLTEQELHRWATKRLKPLGKKISAAAMNSLAFMAGRDLTRLSGELDKLAAYTEERSEISESDVEAIVSASLEYNIFELLNRLLEGKLGDAQRMCNTLLRNGENPIGILAMLTRQLRQLAHMRLALNAGGSVQSVQDTLKLHSYAAKQIAKQCRMLPAETFKALYEACVETDFQIKSGLLRDSAALNSILLKIASAKLAVK